MRKERLIIFSLALFITTIWLYSARATEERKLTSPGATSEITKPLGFTAVVAHQENNIVLRNAAGQIVAEKKAGDDDAGIIQQAVDSCRNGGGEVRIMAGKYDLKKSIILDFPCTLSGEGRGTVLIPPPNDYAIRLVKSERSPSLLYIWGPQKVESKLLVDAANTFVMGIKVQSLAIIGFDHGKGIHLSHIAECMLNDLWIHTTPDGAALYADYSVLESYFSNIYCVRNGNVKNREGTIVIRSQDDGDANNNLHFSNIHVIYPNYTGLEIGSEKKTPPRLIFFTQSFFHGTLPIENASPYDLIRVHATDPERGIAISASRITHTGKDHALVHVENGMVDITDCVVGGGTGKAIIMADPGTKVSIRGNTFEGVRNLAWIPIEVPCLDATRADITFTQNKIDPKCRLNLNDPVSAIVTANRFGRPEKEAIVCSPKRWFGGKKHIQIFGNVFVPTPETKPWRPDAE